MRHKHSKPSTKGKGGGARAVTDRWIARARKTGAAKGKKPKARGKAAHGY